MNTKHIISALAQDQGKDSDARPPRPEDEQKPETQDRPGSQGPGAGGPQPGGREPQGQGQYSIEQAVSDRAQLTTIAFDGLAFLTGDFGCNTFLPPGKVADFCGFQYMRDVDTNQLGHNTSFVPRAANNMLYIFTEKQKADLAEIVKTRRAIATELRKFMKEHTESKDKVLALSKRYGELDGEISYFYATAFAQVAKTLTAEQKKTLLKLRNLDAKFTCKGAYLYSRAIDMPEVPNTDFLFAAISR